MAAADELRRLLDRAGVRPYRRVGKVRVAYDPRTPNETVRAAIEAVKKFAPALVDVWGEPAADVMRGWQAAGLVPADVCDDPCPKDIDPAACPPGWLVARCERYHFRLAPAGPGKVTGVALDGWRMDVIRPLLPAWFVDASRKRLAELADAVAAAEQPPAAEPAAEPVAVPPAPPPPDDRRREMVAVCQEMDALVERSGVPGTVPFVAALAVRAVELHAAGDLDGLHTLRRVLVDELPRLRAEQQAAPGGGQ